MINENNTSQLVLHNRHEDYLPNRIQGGKAMKKRNLCIVTVLILLSVACTALAVTTIGPLAYCTLISATKTKSGEPKITFANVVVEDVDLFYTLYVRHNEDDCKVRVTPYYDIYDGDNGLQSEIYYMPKYASCVTIGDKYAVRVYSHEDTGTGVINTIEATSFIP